MAIVIVLEFHQGTSHIALLSFPVLSLLSRYSLDFSILCPIMTNTQCGLRMSAHRQHAPSAYIVCVRGAIHEIDLVRALKLRTSALHDVIRVTYAPQCINLADGAIVDWAQVGALRNLYIDG